MPDDYQGVLEYLNALKGKVHTPGRDGARAQGQYTGFCQGYALRGPDLIPDARSHSENVEKLRALDRRWGDSEDPDPMPDPVPDPIPEVITEEMAAASIGKAVEPEKPEPPEPEPEK